MKRQSAPRQPDLLLFGFHAVSEAIRAGRRKVRKIMLARGQETVRGQKISALANEAGIPVERVHQQALDGLVGHRRHQGLAAEVSAYPFVSLETLIRDSPEPPLLLVLDQIVDPQNFGAMARTAQCVGAGGIIITRDRSAQPTASVSKASAGAIEHMPVASVTNLAATLQALKKAGIWIAGADRHGQVDLFRGDFSGALAIVIGGEEKGLRPLVRKQCDFTVAIPQIGPIGSLNASAAAAVLLYEAFRQRRDPGRDADNTAGRE